MSTRVCSVEDCDREHYSRGFCYRHWRRWRERKPIEPPRATHRTAVVPRRYV